MLQCYNRGCGQKFNSDDNQEDSCLHHPGEPFFHDAYKGWSCCNRKTVDFTEFLNMKGCTKSKHSTEKPVEPVKPERIVEYEEPPVKEIRKPIKSSIERPPFITPLIKAVPKVMPALRDAINALQINDKTSIGSNSQSGGVDIGTACKNGGCQCSYSTPDSEMSQCQYHPGSPIFHEGMKYWSCCQKKTTDFTAFMNQKGCSFGKHKWTKNDGDDGQNLNCRYDWHQTGTNVILAIYAKLYHFEKSSIQLNPIRLVVSLIFPEQNNAEFNLDLELRGVIKVEDTTVTMYGTKVEITMPKAEAGSWSKLDFPRKTDVPDQPVKVVVNENSKESDSSDSDVDLDDLKSYKNTF